MLTLDPPTGPEHPTHHLTWRTSSHSLEAGECVQAAHTTDMIAVRDSKDTTGPTITVTTTQWRELLTRIKSGDHDLA